MDSLSLYTGYYWTPVTLLQKNILIQHSHVLVLLPQRRRGQICTDKILFIQEKGWY